MSDKEKIIKALEIGGVKHEINLFNVFFNGFNAEFDYAEQLISIKEL